MRSTRNQAALVICVGAFLLAWSAQTHRDIVMAQSPTPIMMTRIYTGADGLSHAEDIPMTLTGGGVSDMIKASGAQFSRRAPGPASDWHVGPRRQFVITLSGRAELTVAGGRKVAVGPGHITLIEDTTGKGHITQNLGPDDRIVVTIPLD
jgi:mannose-6-phosphate isomerase-like protein (cupin superfamily)